MRQRSIIVSFILASGAGIVAILSVLLMALDVIQETTTNQSIRTVEGAMISERQQLNALVSDNSWWNDAIENILINYDEAWVEQYFRTSQDISLEFNGAMAFDRRQTPIFHNFYGSPLEPNQLHALTQMLSPLINEANEAPLKKSTTVSGFIRLSGDLYLASVSAFTPEDETYEIALKEKRGFLVFFRQVNEAMLMNLESNFHLTAMTYVSADRPDPRSTKPALAIYDPIGKTLGYLTWVPPSITNQLTGVLSLTLTVLLFLATFGSYLFRKLVKHVDSLEDELIQGKRNTRLLESKNITLEKIACGETVDSILEHLALSIESVLEGVYCAVFQFDRDTSRIKKIVAPSLDNGFVNAFRSIKVDPSLTLHESFLRGENLCVTSLRDEPIWSKYLNRFNVSFLKSAWSESITSSDGQLIGGLIMYQGIEGKPTEEQQEIVRSNANVAGIVLEHKINTQKLEFFAYYDPITNLVNRHLFRILTDRAIQNQKRQHFSIALLQVDIDRFKHINDSLGHDIADRILIEIADRIAVCVRQTDTVARIGGDEFAILITNPVADEGIGKVAEKVVCAIREPIQREGKTLHLTASVGIAIDNKNSASSAELFTQAETALNIAKESGRDQYHFYDAELDSINEAQQHMEQQLRQALDNNEFSLVYQPKISFLDHQITGLEALIRWNNPALGMVPPDRFIPLAETNGMILPISDFVVETACKQLQSLHKEGFEDLTMAINLSAKQFKDNHLFSKLRKSIQRFNLQEKDLELELTETLIMEDKERAKITLRQLQEAGFTVSIDDFGTGYSSLSYLQYFPLNKLKVDRSFVMNIPENKNDRELSAAIIALAHKLNLNVVAEGVETEAQADFLSRNNCDEAQGYFYSKPLAAKDLFESLIVLRQKLFELHNQQ